MKKTARALARLDEEFALFPEPAPPQVAVRRALQDQKRSRFERNENQRKIMKTKENKR